MGANKIKIIAQVTTFDGRQRTFHDVVKFEVLGDEVLIEQQDEICKQETTIQSEIIRGLQFYTESR